MGVLNPLFLLAAAAVAVPIWLHLFQRRRVRKVSFPALRYLERTEKEHARRIRLRQLALLLLRVTALLLVVVAGARGFLRGPGSAHPPTALVIVLDNSLSSGLVVGEERVLDHLKRLAEETLLRATPEDRVRVVLAGEPWEPAAPGPPDQALGRIRAAEVSAARGDLTAALHRAAALAAGDEMEAAEVHLLSDLQSTAFTGPPGRPWPADVPLIVAVPDHRPPGNRFPSSVVVGGGMPVPGARRIPVAVTLEASGIPDTIPVPVRLVVAGRIRGVAAVRPGSTATLTFASAGAGWVDGYVETDADALRFDDRRYFAVFLRPPPTVAVAGDVSVFLEQAVQVLEDGGRLRRQAGDGETRPVLISAGGAGLADGSRSRGAVVFPPADPALLPGANRMLAAAGIPFRYRPRTPGGEAVVPEDLPSRELSAILGGIRVARWYELRAEGTPPMPATTLVRLGNGDPWLVEGATSAGRYILLASPVDATSSTLPVSPAMIRFLDWAVTRSADGAARPAEGAAGRPLDVPRGVTHVRLPSGARLPVGGSRSFTATAETGIYELVAGERTVARVAVNPPVPESRLRRIDPASLDDLVGVRPVLVRDEGAWEDAIFRVRQGPEIWWPAVFAALLLLIAESLVASAGRTSRSTRLPEAPRGVLG